MSRTYHHGERRIRVKGVRRDQPDMKRLSRALIELAKAQAEADAQRVKSDSSGRLGQFDDRPSPQGWRGPPSRTEGEPMKHAPPTWYELRWPREVSSDQLLATFSTLTTVVGTPCILEVTSGPGGVIHRLGVESRDLGGFLAQVRDAIPGLGLSLVSRSPLAIDRAYEIRLSTRARALRTDNPEQVARSVLNALALVGRGEALTLQWVLGRPLIPSAVPKDARHTGDHPIGSIVTELLNPNATLDSEARTALRLKRGEPGWRALGRVGVRAATRSRQGQLATRVIGALRTAESPGLHFRIRPINPKPVSHGSLSWRYPTRLNLSELVTVAGWPIGKTSSLPVASAGSRSLPPAKTVPRTGRVFGTATYPGRERNLAMSPVDSLRHTEVLGPTGTGKSTLLVNLIIQDMEANRGVLVLDPKGDLIADLIGRIPAERHR